MRRMWYSSSSSSGAFISLVRRDSMLGLGVGFVIYGGDDEGGGEGRGI